MENTALTITGEILAAIGDIHHDTGAALRHDPIPDDPPWLQDGNAVREKLENGWFLTHPGEGSSTQAIVQAVSHLAAKHGDEPLEPACTELALRLAAPVRALLARAERQHALTPAKDPANLPANPWQAMDLPLNQQLAAALHDTAQSLGDLLPYDGGHNTAFNIETLQNLRDDINALLRNPSLNHRARFTRHIALISPSIADELDNTSRDFTSNLHPSWQNAALRADTLGIIIQAYAKATAGLSQTHKVHTASQIARILLAYTEETAGALYLRHGDGDNADFPNYTVPEPEAMARLLELTAHHLMSWCQQLSIQTEEAIMDHSPDRLAQAMERAHTITNQAAAAALHGAIPEFVPTKDLEDIDDTLQQSEEVARLKQLRLKTLTAGLDETAKEHGESGEAVREYLWELLPSDAAAVRTELERRQALRLHGNH